jgi:hypothetical protein
MEGVNGQDEKEGEERVPLVQFPAMLDQVERNPVEKDAQGGGGKEV